MESRELSFSPLSVQAQLVRTGVVSPRTLVENYLERITNLDRKLNAYRVVFAERALLEADQAGARAAEGDTRPLLGVPLAIKDDADAAGEVTQVGTSCFDKPAFADAEAVRRLRAAGAIIIGKTNVPELTQWPFTETTSYGVTRNPWNPERTPGGSSGGAGAAVAAGLAAGALGSDGAGSIRIPAACCGLFGIKPQRGRVPMAPQTGQWNDMAVYGPITHTVHDGAMLLDALTAGGPETGGPELPPDTFASYADREPGRLRIALVLGIPAGLYAPLDKVVEQRTRDLANLLAGLGHTVEEAKLDYGLISLNVTARYLRGIANEVAKVPHPERLEKRTHHMAKLGRMIPDSLFARTRNSEPALAARINKIYDKYDVVLTPTLSQAPLQIGKYEGKGALKTFLGAAAFTPFAPAWNSIGQPAVAVPAGTLNEGMPASVQLLGRYADEATLISLAAEIEQAQPWADRRPPVS